MGLSDRAKDYSEFSTGKDPSEYSRENFYVSEARRTETEMVRVRIPNRILRQMSEMIHSGKYPYYRTYSDIVRDAIFHRAHDLVEMNPELSPLFEEWFEQEMIEHRIKKGKEISAYLENCEYLLKSLHRGTDDGERDDILNSMRRVASNQSRSLSQQILDMVRHYE